MVEDKADIVIIGAGLAGLVAACEAADSGRRVVILDQEGEQTLGGQAFWSLGGLFMVDTPEQRRLGVRDSRDLAWADWQATAGWDREGDESGRRMAEAYVEFAAGEMRPWLHGMGMRWFPVPGWAERGGGLADGHGNSVPRFHLTWGTGPGVLEPFLKKVREHEAEGRVNLRFRHRVTDLDTVDGAICGVSGVTLAPHEGERSTPSPQAVTGDFSLAAEAVIIASGGIGGNFEKVRQNWPEERFGPPPNVMVAGVPAHVDGRMLDVAESAGAALHAMDRMWHYTEGLRNYAPVWDNHGIRVIPGPNSLWFDALGRRMEAPNFPGFDTVATLKRILAAGHDWSWFVTTPAIMDKEFALSGSEQNPDFTGKDWKLTFRSRVLKRGMTPVRRFLAEGEDFILRDTLEELVPAMNELAGVDLLDPASIRRQVALYDAELVNPFCKDAQIAAIRAARLYRGDRLVRAAKPAPFLDGGPLVAIRMNILTRKSLGGIRTDLNGVVVKADGTKLEGLYACGEAAGFGGGAFHGYGALEGTFLGGCIFSGRLAGKAAGSAIGERLA